MQGVVVVVGDVVVVLIVVVPVVVGYVVVVPVEVGAVVVVGVPGVPGLPAPELFTSAPDAVRTCHVPLKPWIPSRSDELARSMIVPAKAGAQSICRCWFTATRRLRDKASSRRPSTSPTCRRIPSGGQYTSLPTI